MLVGGEAGIGKTRLAAQFAATVHERGSTVLFGRCDEEALRPYQPVAEALSSYVHALPADSIQYRLGRSATELSTLVPELSDRVPGVVGSSWSDAESMRFRMFEAVALLLTGLSDSAPVLLVVDDLHWADKATLLLVRHLTRHADLGRVLLLATHRDEATSPLTPFADMLIALDREHVVSHIRLTGLDDADVTTLLDPGTRERLDARALALAQTLRDGTEGNPFFIRETLRHLAENGDIYQEDGQWVAGTRLERLGVPSGVRGVVAQRLSRFSEPANRALAAAAVIGREFRLDVLDAVTDLDEESVFETLDDAVRAGLLREVPAVVGAYSFAHALVRQTIYEGLTTNRRARLHHRVGNALEAFYAGRPDAPLAELAYHYCQAAGLGDDAKAIEYATASRRSGDAATRVRGRRPPVRDGARCAQRFVGERRHPQVRAALRARRGGVARERGPPGARELPRGRAARPSTRRREPARDRGAGLRRRRTSALVGSRERRRRGVCDPAAPRGARRVRARRFRGAGAAARLAGTPALPVRRSRAAATTRRRVASRWPAGSTTPPPSCMRSCTGASRVGSSANTHERLAVSNEALELAQALDQRELVMQALMFRLADLMELGDVTAADADAAVLESTAREMHAPYYQWATLLYSAMRALLEGRFAEAEAFRTEGFELGLRVSPINAAGLAGAQLAVLCREQGRVDELLAIITAAHRVVPTSLVVASGAGHGLPRGRQPRASPHRVRGERGS